jgi:glycosyltransferase involved in cell wall biosynthesis
MMNVIHLTASTFHGGPERQILGLARALVPEVGTQVLSFAEGGRAAGLVEAARSQGIEADTLAHDTPYFRAATRELTERLAAARAQVLCVHGYKAGLLGRIAARRAGIPVVAVSRGWTHENPKVRLYEVLDRLNLRAMDRVVCVSHVQAAKVREARVPDRKIVVLPNAIRPERFDSPDPAARGELERLFSRPVTHIVGAAGRLSPEKGFDVLIDAVQAVARSHPSAGFVLFGEGGQREALERRIAKRGLMGRFVLAGFRPDMDRLVPHLDLLVQSSHTEGMPNVVLEACAAGVAVVATSVGGTPEIIVDGTTGLLVPPGDSSALARSILELLGDHRRRRDIAAAGRQRVRSSFTFEEQASRYLGLFRELVSVRSDELGAARRSLAAAPSR